MCHITYINKVDKDSLREFMSILKVKGKTNSDGFGIFDDNETIFKSQEQFSKGYYKDIRKRYKKSGFLIGHNRLATDGKVKKRNSHPFETKNFVYVHNGIIRNFKDINKELLVDSEVFGFLLEKEYLKTKDIVKSIQATTKKLKGYFSIFVYCKKKKQLFYIRHEARFEFYKVKHGKENYIFGTTDETIQNDLFVFEKDGKKTFDNKTIKSINIEDNKIYRVAKNSIKEVGSFEALQEVYCFYDWKRTKKKSKKKSGFFNLRQYYEEEDDEEELLNDIVGLLYEYINEVVELRENEDGTYTLVSEATAKEIIESMGFNTNSLGIEDLEELHGILDDMVKATSEAKELV